MKRFAHSGTRTHCLWLTRLTFEPTVISGCSNCRYIRNKNDKDGFIVLSFPEFHRPIQFKIDCSMTRGELITQHNATCIFLISILIMTKSFGKSP